MKSYSIIKLSSWSANALKQNVERALNEKSAQGYEIVSVALAVNAWWIPTAFITVCEYD